MYDSYEDFIRNTGYMDDNIGRAAWNNLSSTQSNSSAIGASAVSIGGIGVDNGNMYRSLTGDYMQKSDTGPNINVGNMSASDFSTWASNPINADAASKMGASGLAFDAAGKSNLGASTGDMTAMDKAKLGFSGLNTVLQGLAYKTNKDVAKKQMQLMDTNIKLANDQYADKVNARKTIGRAFS